ncbi:unnamed protein product [Cochlearia groenlandica]
MAACRKRDESPSKPNNNKKKKPNKNPETNLLYNLNSCSKSKDLIAALAIYDEAVASNEIRLNQQHFQTLLYLCSAFITDPSLQTLAIDRGYKIFDSMVSSGICPNEASVTSVARLASAKGDGDYAFKIVKDFASSGGIFVPRLRTYAPALLCFCEKSEAEKGYEVEEHMVSSGIALEEAEISALLKVSVGTGRGNKVYTYLHKLREYVGSVSEETSKVIEEWFRGEKASIEVSSGCDVVGLLREAVLKNGGGWHGLGWVGEGKWIVKRCNVGPTGRCLSCSEQLACVDTNKVETEKFVSSLVGLAMERKAKMNSYDTKVDFSEFQEWLEKHGDYEAIIDGANIGLYQQNFEDGSFSLSQLEAVVNELYLKSGNKKWPLILLHKKRVKTLLENSKNRDLVEEWIHKGVLYATPPGYNDDWYWLYAAAKLKCLLVTNDEMRDHIFELLGNNFFQKWKERHQVRYTFVKGTLKLEMPSPFSVVIQESEKGSWHVPVSSKDNEEESSRTWMCISRVLDSTKINGNIATSGDGEAS